MGETNIAIRFSEFESIESVELVKDMVQWVWVDCFTLPSPLTPENYARIKATGLKICLVSPELQGHPVDKITEYKKFITDNAFEIDAVCTKYYNTDGWRYWVG